MRRSRPASGSPAAGLDRSGYGSSPPPWRSSFRESCCGDDAWPRRGHSRSPRGSPWALWQPASNASAVPANHVTRLIAAGRLDISDPAPLARPPARRPHDSSLGAPLRNRSRTSGRSRRNRAGERRPARQSLRRDPSRRTNCTSLRAGDRVEALVKARPPRNFLDPGAFDLRGYLARQKIDLTGSLRSGELLQLIDRPRPTFLQRLARARGSLLARLDALFPGRSPRARLCCGPCCSAIAASSIPKSSRRFRRPPRTTFSLLRACTSARSSYSLFWICRRLRFSIGLTAIVTLGVLAAYVGVVQDRPPILRAALMAALYLLRASALPPRRIAQYDCARGARASPLETVLPDRLELPAFVSRRGRDRRARAAVDGPYERAVSQRACGISATSRATARIRQRSRNSASKCAPPRNGSLSRLPRAVRAPRERAVNAADSRRAAPLGNRAALSGDSMGNDAAVGAGFSSREPGRAAQQYSGGDFDRPHRAARIPGAAAHIRVDAARLDRRKSGWILRGPAARDRGLVQPPAARFLPHSGPADMAGPSVFRSVHCSCGSGARRRVSAERDASRRRQLPPPIAPARVGGGSRSFRADSSRRVASVRAESRTRATRSQRARCGTRRLDFRRLSRRPHHAD